MTDFSLDQIGRRLSSTDLSPDEQILAADDKVRADWLMNATLPYGTLVDVGASDGWFSKAWIARGQTVFAIERHPSHWASLTGLWAFHGEAVEAFKYLGATRLSLGATVCGEVLEHIDLDAGEAFLRRVPTNDLIVTVPNRHSASYEPARSRWHWPDHRRHFTALLLRQWLRDCGWTMHDIAPIVGTLDDSIWLGAVCRRLR